MAKKISKVEYIKIFSRISKEDYNRLSAIKNKYGFKSSYQIIQYLLYCFLRVADPDNDHSTEPIPTEIEEMFLGLSEGDIKQMFTKPMRRCPHISPDDL